jgi:hypothetical protein
MSSGLYLVLGLVIGSVVTGLAFARTRRQPPPVPTDQVSEETLARACDLVARGRIVHAVKVIRDETGWDLRRSKDVVDGMRYRRKDGGFYGGPL